MLAARAARAAARAFLTTAFAACGGRVFRVVISGLRFFVLHRTRTAFAAAISHIAARGGRSVFSRLRRAIFHWASVAFRAAIRLRRFAGIIRFIKSENRDGKRQNEHRGQCYQNFFLHYFYLVI